MPQSAPSISALAGKITDAIPLEVRGRKVALALYRLLAEGQPVPLARIAKAVDLPEGQIKDALGPAAAFYDDHGAVVGFGGLAVI